MEKHGNKPNISLLTRLKRFFLIFLFVCPALFVFLYLALFIMQRHLLFPTHIANASRLRTPADYYFLDFNETALTASDGVKIEGWDHAPGKVMPVILYFHGNGENIAARAERYAAFAKEGYGVFALEYRGYGNNKDFPSEEGLYKDVHAAVAWVRQAYPSTGIILYGESLGSGVAVEIAKERPVFGVVLQSAYTSIPNRVEEIYWFLPGIRYLVRDRFDSLSKIAGIHSPILIIHGGRDGVIPISHGEKLAKAATGRKEFVIVPDAGHMDIPDSLIVSAMKKFFVPQAANKEPAHE